MCPAIHAPAVAQADSRNPSQSRTSTVVRQLSLVTSLHEGLSCSGNFISEILEAAVTMEEASPGIHPEKGKALRLWALYALSNQASVCSLSSRPETPV